jgi:alkylhydroperoxidase family enzyme
MCHACVIENVKATMLSRRSLFRGAAAAARAKGMTDAQYTEALAVIAMASQTNALATALGVEVDERFRV